MAGASGQWTENELGSMLSNWFREQSKRFPAPPMGANDLAAARPAGYYSGGRPSAQGEAQAMEQMATANALTEQLPLGGRISPEMWNFGKMNSASDLAKAKLMRDATEAAISVGLYGGQKAKGYAKARNKFSALWDKQPRFEIDDSASVFKGSTKPSAPLSEVLEHKSLYEQYPQLKRLNVEFKGDPSASVLNQGRRGSFGNNKITIDNVYSAKEAEKTLLHEVQHAIQEVEGFAPGGNPEIILNNAKKTANNLILRANTEIPKLRGDLMVAKDAAEKRIISGKIDYLWKSSQDAAQKVNSLDSFGQYKRLAGEFEARDAAARSALNATQRAGTKPYSSENIAVKDLIVNKSGGKMMSKVDIKPKYVVGNADDMAREAHNYNSVDDFATGIGEKYRKVGVEVDGRNVINADDIPNMSSIEASMNNPIELSGIREIPMSDFAPGITGKHYSVQGTNRIAELGESIKQSNDITPLIVAIDDEGPYILEGSTRVDALYNLGAKSFPAKVVVDRDAISNIWKKANK